MENYIHPTAIVSPTSKLGSNNYVGPYCIIGPNVVIGSNNRFEAYVSIGTSAEHRDYFNKAPGKVEIGNNCIIRESVTINAGTTGTTRLGDNITILKAGHIGHDAQIENNVTISCGVLVGGHSIVGQYANIGLGCCIHQFRVIGSFTMIGMNSAVTKHLQPFLIYFGSPAESQRVNIIGLTRSGVKDSEILNFERWFVNLKSLDDKNLQLDHKYSEYLDLFYENIKKLENNHISI